MKCYFPPCKLETRPERPEEFCPMHWVRLNGERALIFKSRGTSEHTAALHAAVEALQLLRDAYFAIKREQEVFVEAPALPRVKVPKTKILTKWQEQYHRGDSVDWDAQPFGKVRDEDIAKATGVGVSTVRRERTKRGIAPYLGASFQKGNQKGKKAIKV